MRHSIIYLIFSVMIFQGCTEPYSPATETFEDLLVVEASISNELKKQQLKLSRTYTFEATKPEIVTGADVSISDEGGNEYLFHYNAQDSLYYSTTPFQAVPETKYTLHITTENGTTYVSEPEMVPPTSQVSVDYFLTEIDGEKGVQIVANSFDPSNSSHYYRYDFQETYKVISPLPGLYEAYLLPVNEIYYDYEIKYRPREGETRICYATNYSANILLTSTSDLAEDRVVDFPVRFIPKNDYRLSHRYSILVKQYVQSFEAFQFYRTLQRISGNSENILSPEQPGFVRGNISATNSNKKVMGYFEVTSVSSQRIFLEYSDLYPNSTLPPFITECDIEKLSITPPSGPKDPATGYHKLVDYISRGALLLYEVHDNNFWMVAPECTDCTSFASNEIPDFW